MNAGQLITISDKESKPENIENHKRSLAQDQGKEAWSISVL